MIGIVILNYETWDVTLQCMESIMEAENEEMIRIYLVDNASTRKKPKEIDRFIKQHSVTYIEAAEIVAMQQEIIWGFVGHWRISVHMF